MYLQKAKTFIRVFIAVFCLGLVFYWILTIANAEEVIEKKSPAVQLKYDAITEQLRNTECELSSAKLYDYANNLTAASTDEVTRWATKKTECADFQKAVHQSK